MKMEDHLSEKQHAVLWYVLFGVALSHDNANGHRVFEQTFVGDRNVTHLVRVLRRKKCVSRLPEWKWSRGSFHAWQTVRWVITEKGKQFLWRKSWNS